MNKKADTKWFTMLFKLLWETYAKNRPEEIKPVMGVWFKVLAGFTIEQVAAGVQLMLRERKYNTFPAPGELVGYVRDACGQMKPAEAWSKALEIVRNWSDWQKGAKAEDPAIHKAIMGLGGYLHLSKLPLDRLLYYRKTFEEHYLEFTRHAATKELPAPEIPKQILETLGNLKDMEPRGG